MAREIQLTPETLQDLIEAVEIYKPKPPVVLLPHSCVEYELKHHPERFHRDDDENVLWCGHIVIVIGDRKNG